MISTEIIKIIYDLKTVHHLYPRHQISLLNSVMMDEIEQLNGDIISCKVLQSLPGVIIVCYEDKNGKSYKGALLDVSRR